MRSRSQQPPTFPNYWTPRQALIVFELLELLQDRLWTQYGTSIQHALREDLQPRIDPRQLPLPFEDYETF